MLSYIKVNDIFDELIDENKKLRECLKVLIEFKICVDLYLKDITIASVVQLNKKIEDVFAKNFNGFTDFNEMLTKICEQNIMRIEEEVSPQTNTSLIFNNFGPNISKEIIKLENNGIVINDSEEDNNIRDITIIKDNIKSDGNKWDYSRKKASGLESHNKSNSVNKQKVIQLNKQMEDNVSRNTFEMTDNPLPIKNINKIMVYISCDVEGCQQLFTNPNKLEEHKLSNHLKGRQFWCDFPNCGFSSIDKTVLEVHKTCHPKEGLYYCPFKGCITKFNELKPLKQHFHDIHKKHGNYRCGHKGCGKKFKLKSNLKIHVEERHSNNAKNIYSCDYTGCQYKTSVLDYLRNHTSNVHNTEPIACDWPGCQFQTKNKSSLTQHSSVHRTERKFTCDWPQCGKAFKRTSGLKTHMKIHLGDKKFACDWPGCEFKTINKNSLSQHSLVHSTEKKFTCDWPQCGKAFKTKLNLQAHLKIHLDDKPFACDWPGCQYRCIRRDGISKHMRRSHKK